MQKDQYKVKYMRNQKRAKTAKKSHVLITE